MQSTTKDNPLFAECIHCGEDIPDGLPAGTEFCCLGCESVYQILNNLGFKKFYELRKSSGVERGVKPQPGVTPYDYFDDQNFLSEHLSVSEKKASVELYLSGVHCAACVWLLEKIPELNSKIVSAKVSFTDSILHLTYLHEESKLSDIAKLIDSLGYKVSAISPDQVDNQNKSQRRILLLQIAVAAVCAGNTMTLAVSLYQGWFTGIEDKYTIFFHWVSLFLTLPIILFSAQPFFKAAIAGIRLQTLHIDAAISLGIIGGFTLSAYNTVKQSGPVYFDSVCMLVFLLLLGRWLQRDGIDRAFKKTNLLGTLVSKVAYRQKENGEIEEVYSASLNPGDNIVVPENSILPADGVLLDRQAHLDQSLLTGESRVVEISRSENIFAGTKNVGSKLRMQISSVTSQTRLGKLVKDIELSQSARPRIVEITDRLAPYFVGVVISLSIFTGVYWYLVSGLDYALERMLALVVVSCPCAIGLAGPIGFSASIRSAVSKGCFIKTAQALESLSKAKTIYFDKTGTLTKGELNVTSVSLADDSLSLDQLKSIISRLEHGIQHPLARALRKWSADVSFDISSNVSVEQGCGIKLVERENTYLLGSVKWVSAQSSSGLGLLNSTLETQEYRNCSIVVLAINDSIKAIFALEDEVREEAIEVVRWLVDNGYDVRIISGDRSDVVEHFARHLGLPLSAVASELSPEEKMQIVKYKAAKDACIMVGDGANDAGALQAASVGIAVNGGVEVSFRVADIYLKDDDLGLLVALIESAKETLRVVRRSLVFSLLYNVLGAISAALGFIGPLGAAVLMPLSSATVVVSSLRLFRARPDWRLKSGL